MDFKIIQFSYLSKNLKKVDKVIEKNEKEALKLIHLDIATAKQTHVVEFPVANIASNMGHKDKVHLQNYARFTPDRAAELYDVNNSSHHAGDITAMC